MLQQLLCIYDNKEVQLKLRGNHKTLRTIINFCWFSKSCLNLELIYHYEIIGKTHTYSYLFMIPAKAEEDQCFMVEFGKLLSFFYDILSKNYDFNKNRHKKHHFYTFFVKFTPIYTWKHTLIHVLFDNQILKKFWFYAWKKVKKISKLAYFR